MNKKIVYIVLILLLIIASLFCYFNYDKLSKYFTNEEWKNAEIAGSAGLENYYSIDGTSSNLIVIGNNYMRGYSSVSKENFDESVSLKNATTSADGEYCIIGEKDGTKIYMINTNVKVWESEVQGTIHGVSVNKNGYSAVIYKQTGYKTLIKVLSPQGDEIFTSYLASTYAIDVDISNDNKKLAIAEISTEGINATSNIKIIDINNLEQNDITLVPLEDNSLVTNIEYTNKNELLIQTDKNIKIIDNEGLRELTNEFDKDTYFSSIENANKPILISKNENGLFDVKYKISIFEIDGEEIEYTLEKLPTIIKTQKNNIALVIENQVFIVNTNGKLVKRYEVSGSVKDLCFFEDGNSLAIVYRDKIDFIKNI